MEGTKVDLSQALIGEPVGLVPRDYPHFQICYGPLPIGDLDTYTHTVLRPRLQCYPCPRIR